LIIYLFSLSIYIIACCASLEEEERKKERKKEMFRRTLLELEALVTNESVVDDNHDKLVSIEISIIVLYSVLLAIIIATVFWIYFTEKRLRHATSSRQLSSMFHNAKLLALVILAVLAIRKQFTQSTSRSSTQELQYSLFVHLNSSLSYPIET